MKNMVIQIGDSDNKLTQLEWANYIAAVKDAVERYATACHFHGSSPFDAPWQNTAWIVAIDSHNSGLLTVELEQIRKSFRQDSVAVMYGATQFI